MGNFEMNGLRTLKICEAKHINGGAISPQSHLEGYARTSFAIGIFALGSAVRVLSVMAGFGDGIKAGVK